MLLIILLWILQRIWWLLRTNWGLNRRFRIILSSIISLMFWTVTIRGNWFIWVREIFQTNVAVATQNLQVLIVINHWRIILKFWWFVNRLLLRFSFRFNFRFVFGFEFGSGFRFVFTCFRFLVMFFNHAGYLFCLLNTFISLLNIFNSCNIDLLQFPFHFPVFFILFKLSRLPLNCS